MDTISSHQISPGSASPAWLLCQQKQDALEACVYWFSMHFAKLSTVSVNEWKKCLVKSGKDNVYIVHFRFTLSAREKMTNLIFRNGLLLSPLQKNCDMTSPLLSIRNSCWLQPLKFKFNFYIWGCLICSYLYKLYFTFWI